MLVVVRTLDDVVDDPTLCRFVCFVFQMHQKGPQRVDRFMVHWYVIGLEHPCQLFRQHNNVGQTHSLCLKDKTSEVGRIKKVLKINGYTQTVGFQPHTLMNE